MKHTLPTAEQLKLDWANNPRWAGVTRTYSAEDVVRLRGSVAIEHSLARLGAEKLWRSLHTSDFDVIQRECYVAGQFAKQRGLLVVEDVGLTRKQRDNRVRPSCCR